MRIKKTPFVPGYRLRAGGEKELKENEVAKG